MLPTDLMKSTVNQIFIFSIGVSGISGTAYAATTLFHYSVNDTDAADLPTVPSAGGSDGVAQGTFSDLLSTNIPTVRVPSSSGKRSFVGASDAGSDEVNSPANQELSNAHIIAARGFTMEA